MKKSIFKRMVSALLVLLLLVTALPTALAAETELTDPAETTVLAELNEPTVPEEPVQPDNPTDPAETPTQPEDPTEPTTPAVTDEPTEESAATVPTEETETLMPLGATDPRAAVTVLSEPSVYVGEFSYNRYDVYEGNPDYVILYGTYHIVNFSYFRLSNGQTGFCIQPYKPGPTGSIDENLTWGSLSQERQNGIALALAYGAPNNGDTSDAGLFATAAVVWDMAMGYRNSDGSFTRLASTGATLTRSPFGDALHKYSAEYGAKYDAILANIAMHRVIPSFTVRYASQIANAQTITLSYDTVSNLYKGSATDTNNVLHNFNYTSNVAGLNFVRNGNVLNITATPDAAKQLDQGVTIRSRGYEVEVSPDVCTVWTSDPSTTSGGTNQLLATLSAATDPTPSYFKLRAEVPDGSLTIEKTSTHGAGSDKVFPFRIYCPDGTYLDRTLKIGESVTLTDLTYGTYVVAEWFTSGWECTNAESTTIDQARWTVTVPSGGTVTVVANNEPLTGTGKFVKTTNTGENLGGWTIPVYTDEACTQHYTTIVTGEDGTISAELPVGIYYAKETVTDDPYWVCDSRVVKFEITPGAITEVRFENTHMGRIEIVKQTSDRENLEGWQFAVYSDAECTQQVGALLVSGADGRIESANLMPATYWIKEIGNVDPEIAKLYDCPTEAQEVTVTAGQTASVTFENVLKTGKISIEKVDLWGNPLAGAKFLLEWSEDGVIWQPVTYSEATAIGGCSSKELVDGCLVSGEDGKITFEGLYPTLHYRLTETAAPWGYMLLTDYAYVGKLGAEDLTVTLTVRNSPQFVLPATGGIGQIVAAIGAATAILCAAAIVVMRKKRA